MLPPAPTWGERRACHFLVAGIANNPNNVELNLTTTTKGKGKQDDNDNKHIQKQKQIGLQIPILSRIPGSRMCIEENNNKDNTNNNNKSNNNIIDIIDSMKWWERV